MAELNNTGTGQWSEVDASNTSPPPDGAPTGTFPAQAEGIWRAIMGALKRFWDRSNGTVTTTGAAGTFLYAPASASFPTAYVPGETFCWKAHQDSLGGDTLNINGLGAKALKKFTASGKAAIAAGEIKAGMFVVTRYDGTDVIVQNPLSLSTSGVTSIADAANGGLTFSASTGAVTAALAPGDLPAKANAVSADLVVIGDSAGGNAAKTATVAALLAVAIPTGAILPFAGTSAPAGYVLCGGQAVSRTTFASLFAVLGTAYGAGDGSTTFNVPDLRGRVPAGVDNMGGTAANRITSAGSGIAGATLGASGGAETVTQTISTLVSHNHTYSVQGGCGGSDGAGSSSLVIANTSSTGSGNPAQNMQPTIIMNYIVKT